MKKNFYYRLIKLGQLIAKGGNQVDAAVNKLAAKIYKPDPSATAVELEKFYKAGGEDLRYDYVFNETSIIFDMGGYTGHWASDIYSRFRSEIYIFEVYKPFAEAIQQRFKYNPDISTFAFGLSSENATTEISLDENSSSAFKQTGTMVAIELVDADEFMKKYNIGVIDLMKINIEGGEYDLLNRLIEKGYHKNIKNLQIQFHDFVPNAYERMNEIRKKLSETHSTTYQFDFVWENWRLK